MALTNYTEERLLEHLVGKTAWTMLTNTYLALFTVVPNELGEYTEVSGGSYARVALSGASWTAYTSDKVMNAVTIQFPIATVSWGAIVAMGLFDASTSGNLVWYVPFDDAVTINVDDRLVIDPNTLSLSAN